MKKTILISIFLFNFYFGICQKINYFKSSYCIVNDTYNEMGLGFDIKKDTVFLSYMNIVDSGKYFNGGDDDEYAGYFITSDMKNFKVKLKIKNYRDEDDSELVSLTFLNNGKKCLWNIDRDGPVGYLPKKAVFKYCPVK